MEEKLYFKPAKYGKGVKKKEKTESDEKPSKAHRIRNLLFFLAFVIIIVLIILWLLCGKTTTSGQFPENVKNESLICTLRNTSYDKAGTEDDAEKEIKINAIFFGTENLKSISLVYSLNYETEDAAYRSEAVSHANFNQNLAASGYSVSKFSNKYARYNNKLIISLTASANEIDEISASYFMIALNDDLKIGVKTLNDYQKMYIKQGFDCQNTVEN